MRVLKTTGEDVVNRHTNAYGTIQGFSLNPRKVFVHYENGDTREERLSDLNLIARYRWEPEPTQQREAHAELRPVGAQGNDAGRAGRGPMAKGRKGKVGV